MAAARFQIFSAASRVIGQSIVDDDGVAAGRHAVTWRFMSANNRSLAQSVRIFPDVESCLAAVRELRAELTELADEPADAESGCVADLCVIVRDGPRHWVWRINLAGVDLVVSSRRYERRVQAKNSCTSFLGLLREAGAVDLAQVVRFQ
jgi:hypothetical protein